MTHNAMPQPLRRLAFMYTPRETFLFHVLEAGAGNWATVFVVDQAVAEVPAQTLKVLPRMATVVDITGMSLEEAADHIAVHRPKGIMAVDDGRLEVAAKLANLLGLRFHSLETVTRLTNKRAQRDALAAAGLDVPRFWPLSASASAAELDSVLNAVPLPAIIKPQMGVSSRNTATATSRDELARLVSSVLPSEPYGLIIEELIPNSWKREDKPNADFVSVESIVSDGSAFHVMVTGKFPLAEPFRETGSFMPADLTSEERSRVLACASAAIKAVGIEVGGVHTEIKLSPHGPQVIEVNGRIGGGHIPQLVQQVSGISLLRLAGLAACGSNANDSGEVNCSQHAYMLRYQAPTDAQEVREVRGLDEAVKLPGVQGVFVGKQPGDSVDWRVGTDGFVWMVEGTAPDTASIYKIVSEIKKTLVVDFTFRSPAGDVQRAIV